MSGYVSILFMMILLLAAIDLLKKYKLLDLVGSIMSPYLKLIGVSKRSSAITIVGMSLGIVYGSSLLIREAESGDIDKDEITLSVMAMSLMHSIIEDNMVAVLMGADLFWIIFFTISIYINIYETIPIFLYRKKEKYINFSKSK